MVLFSYGIGAVWAVSFGAVVKQNASLLEFSGDYFFNCFLYFKFCTGNLYEEGNLNFLTVIQLLNEALMTLRDEYCPCKLKELHGIEDMVTSCKNALRELNTER